MMENYQVRFLGEGEAVMSLPYPTFYGLCDGCYRAATFNTKMGVLFNLIGRCCSARLYWRLKASTFAAYIRNCMRLLSKSALRCRE
jgi:hypothetical protein